MTRKMVTLDSTKLKREFAADLDDKHLRAYSSGQKTLEMHQPAGPTLTEGVKVLAANDTEAINATPLEDFASGKVTIGAPPLRQTK